jgi:hypothetical protein
MLIRSATDLLDEFALDGLVVEVTHRAKRRLFALRGLTPPFVMKSPRLDGRCLSGHAMKMSRPKCRKRWPRRPQRFPQ